MSEQPTTLADNRLFILTSSTRSSSFFFFFFKGNNFSIVKHIVRDVVEAKSLNEFKKESAEF